MITKELKAAAIAKIHLRMPLEEIALELDIPLPLIKEWYSVEIEKESNKSAGELVMLAANLHAVQKLGQDLRQEIIPSSSGQEGILKAKIEEVAIEIAEQVSMNLITSDILRAKTLQLCADTVTKLYNSLITKAMGPDGSLKPSDDSMNAFRSIMKD